MRKRRANMGAPRRLGWPICVGSRATASRILLAATLLQLTHFTLSVSLSLSPSQPTSTQTPARHPIEQYASSSSSPTEDTNANNFKLVKASDTQSPQAAQKLPLIRQQQQQQPDLDNVIETTTSLLPRNQANTGGYSPSSAERFAGTAQARTRPTPTSCQLPPTWAGKWYQSNKELIRVTNTEISDKGLCRDQKGDKYLFEYTGTTKHQQQQQQPQQAGSCLVCLVINERHLNVLQYKESSCQPIPANYYNRSTNNLIIPQNDDDHSLLDSICSDITGDAQLESLFRLDTPAIECPIIGQYSFTYDGCREPYSSLDSCIDKKQLNFKFSACPDVPGSESKCKY